MRQGKRMRWLVVVCGLLLSSSVTAATYVQTQGHLCFESAFQGQTFRGSFPGFSTTMVFDPDDLPSSRLDVTIPLGKATTNNAERDVVLKGGDFFDVARFGTARYTAQGFQPLGEDRYRARGHLELRGVRHPVVLTFTLTLGDAPVLMGQANVSRRDFSVGGGDWADGELIPLQVEIGTRVQFRQMP